MSVWQARQSGRRGTEARYVQASSNPVCCKLFVMERSESNFLFRAYVFANASAVGGHYRPSPWEPRNGIGIIPGAGRRKGFDVMNTQELAKAFTDMCAKGELEAAGKKFWSDDIVSREPMTGDMAELKGRRRWKEKPNGGTRTTKFMILRSRVLMCTGINSSFASSWMSRQRARNASTSMRSGFTRSGKVGSSRKAFSWVAGNPNRIAASGSACSKRARPRSGR